MKIAWKNENTIPLFSIITLVLMLVPLISTAQGNIVPDCSPNCGYQDLLQLVNNIIKWIIMISFPVAAGVFAWAGITMMANPTNPGKRKESIDMMKKVFIGFAVVLSAWIIVTTITNTLLSDKFKGSGTVEGVK